MRNRTLQKRGGALLTALLVMTLLGSLGFGLIRISLMQVRTITIGDASIQAYHAAEAGIEWGLLQYRLNKDGEISYFTSDPTASVFSGITVIPAFTGLSTNLAFSSTNDIRFRYNLTRDTFSQGGDGIPATNLSDQQFDLLMSHHTMAVGEPRCLETVPANILSEMKQPTGGYCASQNYPIGELKPGETHTFILPTTLGNSGGPVPTVGPMRIRATTSLDFNMNGNYDASRPNKLGVLVIDAYSSANKDDGTEKFLRQLTFPVGGNATTHDIIPAGTNGSYTVSLPLSTRMITLTYYGSEEGAIDTGNLRYVMARVEGTKARPIDSGITVIESVGRSGFSTRRLRATIDRETDQVIGIFDYGIYTNSLLTP